MFGFGRKAIIVAVVLCIAAVIYAVLVEAWGQQPATQAPDIMPAHAIPPQYRALVLKIERDGVEQGYKQQIVHLFEGWVKDHRDQPARALRGVEVAREAFVDAMQAIDRRAAELEREGK
jgi:hypothetical protein